MMVLKKPTDETTLKDLLNGLATVNDTDDRSITGLSNDSRHIEHGDLFIANKGQLYDATEFIQNAADAGASAALVDSGFDFEARVYSIPVTKVEDLSTKSGIIADRFYKHPSAALKVTGITGTNGKTSTAFFIAQALNKLNANKVSVIGTLGIGMPGNIQHGVNTTPDALTIHREIRSMQTKGVNNLVMEVSSHALEQKRVAGVKFDIAVFTNLSREHLDYHGDMAMYANAKRQLFLAESLSAVVINTDDEFGQELVNEFQEKLSVLTYGLDGNSIPKQAGNHISGKIIASEVGLLSVDVTSPWGEGNIRCALTGEFNVSNLLASLAVLCVSGIELDTALQLLSKTEAVPGRMECFSKKGEAKVIVDYAHTPDALQKSLQSLRNLTKGRLICVVGCGGDRDPGKRPIMAKIAETFSDKTIFTSDNPRNENPETIVTQMLSGVEDRESIRVILDRAEAIRLAISSALADDVILVAGKGHETYQEIANVRTPFSDRQLVRNLLEQRG
jgi:UDP-N-acetylmuramoyl-L-alanyl-D-glutamate--2,6-diaminopimelate ligase